MTYNSGKSSQGGGYTPPNPQALKDIVKGGPQVSALTTIAEAERLAKYLVGEQLKSAQIRLIFSKVRQIEARWTTEKEQHEISMREMLLLKPRMQYQAKRIPALQKLADVLISLMEQVEKRDEFQRFVDFSEAVVAYHKVHGGRD